ncbi:DUF4381 domain-containing protein [Tropicimonas sp. TH_r6]|uniref:DUF4381 domain-containing protein n=1 Tax=Tropicimonas sp. TH_r6 TaxID=3082085 RepID=UPI002953071B|nr:DUF4381 domain-containing protein [Tropicimonas sp. TH_r6]MDV7144967.1 DUF4381 domain-containing protein [Tropicimonas sp. TH_r6]
MTDLPETEGKNLIELLDMLKPIPEPEPISMFPATSGWIWLGLALAALLLWAALLARRHWRANAYRRAALAELDGVGEDPVAIAEILRRTALVAFPRAQVAGLSGDDWLAFLDDSHGGSGFASDLGEILLTAPYRQLDAPETAGLHRLARSWIRTHRRPTA